MKNTFFLYDDPPKKSFHVFFVGRKNARKNILKLQKVKIEKMENVKNLEILG